MSFKCWVTALLIEIARSFTPSALAKRTALSSVRSVVPSPGMVIVKGSSLSDRCARALPPPRSKASVESTATR